MQHILIYTVCVRQKFVWLRRDTNRYRIGSVIKSGAVRYWSNKCCHILDEEDRANIAKAFEERPDPEQDYDIGSIQFIALRRENIELRVLAGEAPRPEVFGTWIPRRGLQLTALAHPAFKKESDELSELCVGAYQARLGGIFRGAEPDADIFKKD